MFCGKIVKILKKYKKSIYHFKNRFQHHQTHLKCVKTWQIISEYKINDSKFEKKLFLGLFWGITKKTLNRVTGFWAKNELLGKSLPKFEKTLNRVLDLTDHLQVSVLLFFWPRTFLWSKKCFFRKNAEILGKITFFFWNCRF